MPVHRGPPGGRGPASGLGGRVRIGAEKARAGCDAAPQERTRHVYFEEPRSDLWRPGGDFRPAAEMAQHHFVTGADSDTVYTRRESLSHSTVEQGGREKLAWRDPEIRRLAPGLAIDSVSIIGQNPPFSSATRVHIVLGSFRAQRTARQRCAVAAFEWF